MEDRGAPHVGAKWDEALTRRLRVLLLTMPLGDLRRSDPHRDPDSRHYDSLALAMKVMDLIVDHAGLDLELDRGGVRQALTPLLCAADEAAGVAPDSTRHEAAIDRVLGGLRNDPERRRPFALEYTTFDDAGGCKRLRYSFTLVRDHFHPAGGTVLRMSNEALNLFLNAIDLDVEDAQAAAEAVVQSQLARGRFDEALQSARSARLQSLRYEEKVVRVLRDTKRNLQAVDWRDAAPRMIDEATGHIQMRLAVEKSIRDTAEERLEAIGGGDAARKIADVIELVRDCQGRHMELHARLMTARNVFLDEQVRQSFAPTPRASLPNLGSDVIDPLLRMVITEAEPIATEALARFFGSVAPPSLSLRGLVSSQLLPRRERSEAQSDVAALDLDEQMTEPNRFSAEEIARADAILRTVTTPTTLSAVLASAHDAGEKPEVLELLALFSLRDFAAEPDEVSAVAVQRARERALVVAGFTGDELELRPIELDNGQRAG